MFYSYVDTDGKQLVAAGELQSSVSLGSGGAELIITRRNDGATMTKMLGSREYLRYYRQKPRPSSLQHSGITAALASRYVNVNLFYFLLGKEKYHIIANLNISVKSNTLVHHLYDATVYNYHLLVTQLILFNKNNNHKLICFR